MEVAKRNGTALILVGHVTKEGAVAGPRVLEHLVDCVLLFEGERERSYRTLRALKNRFGATSEVGVFEMRSGGLVEVEDPSARFVGEATSAPGSVVLCSMEGTRPLLVEVQALVAPTEIVPPRRVANGIDRNRLAMILAVLARHGGVRARRRRRLRQRRRRRPGRRAGRRPRVALAIASAHRGEPLADAQRQAARLLRRGRADRRAALRGPRRAPRGRGAQVRARPGARPAPREAPDGTGDERDVARSADRRAASAAGRRLPCAKLRSSEHPAA